MMLPHGIAESIDALCEEWSAADLREAAADLMEVYRETRHAPALDEAMVTAYLAIRVPATYAAISAVLGEAILRVPGISPTSHLDLGAGPGTACWASMELFEGLTSVRAIEAHDPFIAVGRSLAPPIEWLRGDLATVDYLPPADLVTAAYSLGELAAAPREHVIATAWQATGQAFCLIEPGTPAGFAVIEKARSQLLALGATIAAPCPHALDCPLAGESGWCHFIRRLARTRRHRLLKEGARGWEDEKFSFLIATKQPANPASIRVLGHPMQNKVSIRFEACTDEGRFEGLEIPRREKEAWKKARKLEWGDGF